MKINGNEIRPGNVIEHDGGLWVAVKTNAVKPGKGGAYNQVELKNLINGTKLNERFRAADAGLADAQYAMSQIHANGAGGKKRDDAEARRWLLAAARQNFDTAQLDLATWLVEGRGGPRDLEAGFGWMSRAAQAGNVAAQNRLAKLYMRGIGAEPNSIDAAAWYFLARRAGLKDPEMEDFLRGLTEEEQKQALARANRLR